MIRVVLYLVIGRPVAWFWSIFGLGLTELEA